MTVKYFASITKMSAIFPGAGTGEHAVTGAHSLVSKDDHGRSFAYGSLARKNGPAVRVKVKDGTDQSGYSWTSHSHRGYPEEILKKWHIC